MRASSPSLGDVLSPVVVPLGERERHDISSRRAVPVAHVIHVPPGRSEQRPGVRKVLLCHMLDSRLQAASRTFHPTAFPNLLHLPAAPCARSSWFNS